MSKFECNSCGAIYNDVMRDGGLYYHVCPAEVIEHAQCDAKGNVTRPEKRTPRPNMRDERLIPGLEYIDGVLKRAVPDPETPGRTIYIAGQLAIRSEGLGRTQIK